MKINEMNAHHILMKNARNNDNKKRRKPSSSIACPAGCGALVAVNDVNDHLDRCVGVSNDDGVKDAAFGGDTDLSNHGERYQSEFHIKSTIGVKRSCSHEVPNAFSHMMKRSAAVFAKSHNKEHMIRHRFHLCNVDGLVKWISDDNDENSNCKESVEEKIRNADGVNRELLESNVPGEEIQWSAVVRMKGMKDYELTISASLPSYTRSITEMLVRRHSRLSVSQLKSCLQKSIRRRAPLPAVRVAMELADKSWSDFVRRLPIIVLEDCTLHPDFGLLVWLMVAESKGYTPCMPLVLRVMQIVFELASCGFRDDYSGEEWTGTLVDNNLSLATPISILLPDRTKYNNACEVFIRSMLLRAEYGGMKCDTQMLHSYARKWLERFQSAIVPNTLIENIASKSTLHPIYWWDIPKIVHERARERSVQLVTPDTVRPAGLLRLNFSDISLAGIDFHCSAIVDYLLLQREILSSFYQMEDENWDNHKIAEQLKKMIWNFSSGINHRSPLLKTGTTGETDTYQNLMHTRQNL